MSKYRVEVKVIASTTYTVEIDAEDEDAALNAACSREIASANTSDFDVDLSACNYQPEIIETLVQTCSECGKDFSPALLRPLGGICPVCDEALAAQGF